MVDYKLFTGHRHVVGDRGLVDRRFREGLSDPHWAPLLAQLQATFTDKHQDLPDTDRGEPKIMAWVGQRRANVIRQPIRRDKAPNPDMRVEEEPHLNRGLPHVLRHGRANNIARDFGAASHRAEPRAGLGFRRRFDFGDRHAPLRDEHRLARLAHALQLGQTSRLELRDGDRFHVDEATMV